MTRKRKSKRDQEHERQLGHLADSLQNNFGDKGPSTPIQLFSVLRGVSRSGRERTWGLFHIYPAQPGPGVYVSCLLENLKLRDGNLPWDFMVDAARLAWDTDIGDAEHLIKRLWCI